MSFPEVRAFLAAETLSHFIEEHHQPLTALKHDSTVADAIKLLREQKILSAPILDEDGEYKGAVSVPDILRGFVRNIDTNLGDGWLDNVSSITAEELNNIGSFFATKAAAGMLHDADLWMKGDASTTLWSVLREGFHIDQTRPHHRVYVCDPAKAYKATTAAGTTVVNIPVGAEKEGASSWVPTDVVTQLDLVILLAEKQLANVDTSIAELGLGKTVVHTVPASTPAIVAFHHMAMDHKSHVGITDAEGKLVGTLAVADLRDVELSQLGTLLQPLSALPGLLKPLNAVAPSAPFSAVLKTVTEKRAHCVYVVDESGKAVSIVTLTDVLRLISGHVLPQVRNSVEAVVRRSVAEQRKASAEEEEEDGEEEEAMEEDQ